MTENGSVQVVRGLGSVIGREKGLKIQFWGIMGVTAELDRRKGWKSNVPELFVEILGNEGYDGVFGGRNAIGRKIFVFIVLWAVQYHFWIKHSRLLLFKSI